MIQVLFHTQRDTSFLQIVGIRIRWQATGELHVFPLNYQGAGHWTISLKVDDHASLEYQYCQINPITSAHTSDQPLRRIPKIRSVIGKGSTLHLQDEWTQELTRPAVLFSTKTFQNLLTYHESPENLNTINLNIESVSSGKDIQIVFRVCADQLRRRESVFVTGNIPELGNWDPYHAKPMYVSHSTIWQGSILLPKTSAPDNIQYKYIVRRTPSELFYDLPSAIQHIRWEAFENREIQLALCASSCVIKTDDRFRVRFICPLKMVVGLLRLIIICMLFA
jgi:hypothetical protein